ncbi:MAG TPA: hypothetical protein VK988_02625 [Acidimicrobiales bacterium]|nr:hypothetical protein [Acidimicrobiales bacterium]
MSAEIDPCAESERLNGEMRRALRMIRAAADEASRFGRPCVVEAEGSQVEPTAHEKADLSPENVQRLADELSDHVKNQVAQCRSEAMAMAAEALPLVWRYHQLREALEVVIPTDENLRNGCDLRTAVSEAIGLEDAYACLVGIDEAVDYASKLAPDMPGHYLKRCWELVGEHRRGRGETLGSQSSRLSRQRSAVTEEIDDQEELNTADDDASPAVDLADCEPCSRRWELSQDHHDWLLTFEQRGLAGAIELMQYLEINSEGEGPEGLGWVDFPTFVAMHNWQDPDAVQSLASMVDDAIRARKQSATATSRLDAVGILARGDD